VAGQTILYSGIRPLLRLDRCLTVWRGNKGAVAGACPRCFSIDLFHYLFLLILPFVSCFYAWRCGRYIPEPALEAVQSLFCTVESSRPFSSRFFLILRLTGFDLRFTVPPAHCVPISSVVQRYEIEVTVRILGAGVFPGPNERTITGASLVTTMWNRGIRQTEPTNPRAFVFSRGLDGKPQGGVPMADVMKGLDNKVWLDQLCSES
jgi:hypothetical protein